MSGGYREGLRELVDERVRRLYEAAQHSGEGTAALARLRRGVGHAPGADPELWEYTLGLGSRYEGGDATPSAAETAVHHALTLFALHQQSQRERMHRRGVGLGRAARRLGRAGASEDAVRRRFQALATASSLDEAVVHARGLVTQFRAAPIPLDYGQFAVDLLDWQDPTRRTGVRLRWGRDYYRAEHATENPSTTDAPEEEQQP